MSKKSTLGIYSASVAIAIVLLSATGAASIGALQDTIISKEQADVRSLAVATEEKFETLASVMEVTGQLPQLTAPPDVSQISSEYNGVPESVEAEKRQVARSILSQAGDIEAVAFLLPDGEMYVEEPFFRQMNLTRTDFAFRDYFQGAVNSQATYLGEVYISASSGASASAMAVPVMPDGELKGVWIGLLHLENLDGFAKGMFENDDARRFVFADQHGHEVVYSNELVFSLEDQSLADFGPYRSALEGDSGWSAEAINGEEMLVAYHPVEAPGATWAVFSVQPYADAMKPVEDLRTQLYAATGIAVAVGAGLGAVIAKKP